MGKRLIICIFVIFSLGTSVFASKYDITIFLDGKELESSVGPVIEDGTTLIPMRIIFEALDMDVYWNQETKTATGKTNETTIDIIVGDNKAYVNGTEKMLSTPAKILNGNTMIPLRFVSESVGCEVNWDGDKREIVINRAGYKNDYISMESTNTDANLEKLYSEDGQGKYFGYKRLRGYPNESEFHIYYKGDYSSYTSTYEDMRALNLNEIITWRYKDTIYLNTRKELYSFFSDTSWFRSNLGISKETLSHDWFMETFKDVFRDWIKGVSYSNDASRLVSKYLEKESNFEYEDRYKILDDLDDISEEFKRLELEEKERERLEDEKAMDRIKELQGNTN